MRASGAGAKLRAAGERVETGAAVPTTRDSFAAYSPIDYSSMNGSDDNIPADECEVEGTWTVDDSSFSFYHALQVCQVPPPQSPLATDKLRETNIVVFIKSFFFKRELDMTSVEEI